MFNFILNNPDLFSMRREQCYENACGVDFCDTLKINGELSSENVLILKPDDYYSSRNMHNPPQSTDCLILIKNRDGYYGFALIELRNVTNQNLVKPREIVGKFETVINRFLSQDFAAIFLKSNYDICWLRLWLVTNPYRWPDMSEDDYRRKIKNTVLDAYQSLKPLSFKGKVAMITPMPPNSILYPD